MATPRLAESGSWRLSDSPSFSFKHSEAASPTWRVGESSTPRLAESESQRLPNSPLEVHMWPGPYCFSVYTLIADPSLLGLSVSKQNFNVDHQKKASIPSFIRPLAGWRWRWNINEWRCQLWWLLPSLYLTKEQRLLGWQAEILPCRGRQAHCALFMPHPYNHL